MEEKNSELIFQVNSVFEETVTLTQEQFENHIINRHPEMKGHENDIQRTIEKPNAVYKSTRYPESRKVFVRKTNNNEISNYNKVVVEYLTQQDATIKTTYYAEDLTGGGECVYINYDNKL